MSYKKQTWVDNVTPVDADHLNHMEDGIATLDEDMVRKNGVTPQMFGAVGDGKTDDTAAFVAAQESDFPVFVPLGKYVVNNFDFSKSKEWVFQRSNNKQWFTGGTTILTSTGITISAGPRISNLVVEYNGTKSIENRPAGVKMKAHFCEIQGMHVSGFYVGMDFGQYAGGHSDYCRIYDLYTWYNYYCGVRLAGADLSQVNFISFFDANVNSNGVDVHNTQVKPDTSRGYGFYVSLANSVYITNADASSNETCGIYIDNAKPVDAVRGFVVDTIYAEHNKFCNIYYNNGVYTSTRSKYIDIRNPYFRNDATDMYFHGDVYMTTDYVPPTVTFPRIHPNLNFPDCYSPDIDMTRAGARKTKLNKFYGRSGNTYKVTLTVMPEFAEDFTGDSDYIYFQNAVRTYGYNRYDIYSESDLTLADNEKIPPFRVKLVPGESTTFTFYVTLPNRDVPLVYDPLTYTASRTKWHLVDGKIENVTPMSVAHDIYGTVPEGTIRVANGVPLIYLRGNWEMVRMYDNSGALSYTNVVPTSQDPVGDGVFNAVGFRNNCGLSPSPPYTSDAPSKAGYCATGIFDYIVPNNGLPPVIYIKGDVSFDNTNNTGFNLWKADKTYHNDMVTRKTIEDWYFTITELGTGYYKLEPIANANGRSNIVDNLGAGVVGLSMCLKGEGYGLIVTLDEPIE